MLIIGVKQILDIHRLASSHFCQWKSTIIFDVQIPHLFRSIRFFQFLRDDFQGDFKNG